MSKHSLSPAPLPPPKRFHGSKAYSAHQKLTFDNSLYDELILCIFSHLSWIDLCTLQATSKNLARLAVDNELWRKLYLKVYGRSRLRGARGYIGRSDGREVKPLPERAKHEDFRDWKWMFRISSNWKRGRCSVEELFLNVPLSAGDNDTEQSYQTHILLAGELTITASSRPSSLPAVSINSPADKKHILPCRSKQGHICQITALAVDQSPPSSGQIRLVSFLSTGEFSVFTIHHSLRYPPSRKLTYAPFVRNPRTSPIMQAVYHHPLLITLSESFALSTYDLSQDSIRHVQTLTSFTCFHPTSLVLSTPSPSTYKLVISYTIHVYPAHWSVGATELLISGPATSEPPPLSYPPSVPSFSGNVPEAEVQPMTVTTTRTIRVVDVPSGWIDERKLKSMREQWGRKLSKVADTQTDGKWVVLAPGVDTHIPTPNASRSSSMISSSSNTSSDIRSSSSGLYSSSVHSPVGLQLYRLSFPPQSSSVSSPTPKLIFVRTLHGQTGPVSALALADGRCVSLGLNGSIWVWDLEGGTGAEVTGVENDLNDLLEGGQEGLKGSISFDERRIITVQQNKVVVRRFDV